MDTPDEPLSSTAKQSSTDWHVEHALLKVPLEQLSKALRSAERIAEKELQNTVNTAEEIMGRQLATHEKRAEAAAQLETVLTKLQAIKRKMSELHAEQATFVKRCEARIHLLDNMGKAFESGRPEEVEQWTRQRVDRILVDHLLREGYYRTAAVLAEEGKLQDYVDLDMFAATRRVEDSLKGRSCAEALAWCSENRSKLRKLKSSLEFNLRLQEYIELVRFGKFNNAITYARKYLTMWMDSNAKDVQMALALLAFPNQETRCERYRQLYDPARWNQLAEQFKNDNFQLYSLTQQSLLNITLQGGLSALKTPMCNELETKSLNCPVCNPQMGILAKSLPYGHHTHSSIVCRISGAIMDPDNPPMMLPNGNVYSLRALDQMQATHGGTITDPRTGDHYKFSESRKVFIM